MIHGRIKDIVRELMSAQGYLTGEELALRLEVSARTVRDTIREYKKSLDAIGIHIESRMKKGYRLRLEEGSADSLTILNGARKDQARPIERADRIAYIMWVFLTEPGYVKLDELADRLWISRSSMNRLFKEVREKFEEYGLELESKPAHGLRLQGEEMRKRFCFAQNCMSLLDIELPVPGIPFAGIQADALASQLRTIVRRHLDAADYHLSDVGMNNLVLHLVVAIYRMREGNYVQKASFPEHLHQEEAYAIALGIAREIQDVFSVEVPECEISYIEIHLQGKRLMMGENAGALITKEVEELTQQINERIAKSLGYDFSYDIELFLLLSLHIVPMLTRIRYGLHMPNPVLEDVRSQLPQGYDCAVIASEVINARGCGTVDDNERGYLAMHYALAIERCKESAQSKRLLVVCSTGMGTAKLLKARLQRKFNLQNSDVRIIDVAGLASLDLSTFDFIFSTVPLSQPVGCPVIYVENIFDGSLEFPEWESAEAGLWDFLADEDCFFNLDLEDAQSVITFLVEHLMTRYDLDAKLLDSVLRREALSSTEVGNLIALPHPMEMISSRTIVSYASLKKPIRWKNKQVRYVFLTLFSKNRKEQSEVVSNQLVDIISDLGKVQQLAHAESYEMLHMIF